MQSQVSHALSFRDRCQTQCSEGLSEAKLPHILCPTVLTFLFCYFLPFFYVSHFLSYISQRCPTIDPMCPTVPSVPQSQVFHSCNCPIPKDPYSCFSLLMSPPVYRGGHYYVTAKQGILFLFLDISAKSWLILTHNMAFWSSQCPPKSTFYTYLSGMKPLAKVAF